MVEVEVAGTGSGDTNADILLDGQVLIEDHLVAGVRNRTTDVLTLNVNALPNKIEVRFDNDARRNNLFIYRVTVDGVDRPLTDGVVVRARNGAETSAQSAEEVALWTNSSFMIDAAPKPVAISNRRNAWFPRDKKFNWGGGEALAQVESILADRRRSVTFDKLGRVLDDTPSDTVVITVPAGLDQPVAFIKAEVSARGLSLSSDDGGHLTIRLAKGTHRFEQKLSIKRSSVAVEGLGTKKTTIVHDFLEGSTIDHAIEFRSQAIPKGRVGFKSGTIYPDSELLADITLRDFSITYAVDQEDIWDDEIPGGLRVEDLREVGSQNFVPKYAAQATHRGNQGFTPWQQQAAISLDGVLEANVINIRGAMVGSHFLGIHESRGVYADALVADGTLNRGGGGNGYALEMIQSHDSIIKFDAVIDFRHLSINNDGVEDSRLNWSTNNVIAAEYTNTNMDVHKLSEEGNLLYAENMVANPYIQAQPVLPNGDDGFGQGWKWSYRLDNERMAWGLFDPRNLNSADNNRWMADNQLAAGKLNRSGEGVGPLNLKIEVTRHTYYEDTLFASANKGYIYGGSDDDVLIGGAGRNVFVFTDDPGTDTIRDFGRNDLISIEKGTLGIRNRASLIRSGRISTTGDDVHIDLGEQQIIIEGAASFFNAKKNTKVTRHVFYDAKQKDFAFLLPG